VLGKTTILRIQEEIEAFETEQRRIEGDARAILDYALAQGAKLESHYRPLLQAQTTELHRRLAHLPVAFAAGWTDDRWQTWAAESVGRLSLLRVGELTEAGADAVTVPAFVPFVGSGRCFVISASHAESSRGAALLQSLAIRTALLLPYQARFTLIDPGTAGRAFPMRRYLPHVRENTGDVRRDLDQVLLDIQRINDTYLDASTTSFDLLPQEVRVNERFQFVFAADFPNQYDRRAIEALQAIAINGPAAGVYLFVHHNGEYAAPQGASFTGFKNAVNIDFAAAGKQGMSFAADGAPSPTLQTQLLDVLAKSKPRDHAIDWDAFVGLPESEWWKNTSETLIETPIGLRGGREQLKLWFGERPAESHPCVHGMLGAMPGAGKSNLLHALLLGLAVRYPPTELRLYLVDGKDGVEFSPYRTFPHAEVVSLSTPPGLARSVVAELVLEMKRRAEIFVRARVNSLTAYRRKGQPEGALPRILLLVDEYQDLFDGDRNGEASASILALAEQARFAGIHMFLVSHAFGTPGMLHQTAIFGSIHLRAALKMTESNIQSLREFGRRGKALIASCDRPGKIVVNDRGEDDTANVLGKVCLLESGRREELIALLSAKAEGLPAGTLPNRVVLDGKAQPHLKENPQLATLVNRAKWPTPEELEDIARRRTQAGGFEIPDWVSAESPRIAWVGSEFNVRGLVSILLRRRVSENVLVVGSNNAARYGMLSSLLVSLSVNAHPIHTRFVIVDRSVERTDWNRALSAVHELVLRPAGFSSQFTQDGQAGVALLEDLISEVNRRKGLSDSARAEQPSVFALFTELDRVEPLRRAVGRFELTDSAHGVALSRLLIEGPALGIHVVLSFGGVGLMAAVIDPRHGLQAFRHRIALQMSDDDSFTLLRSRGATQLQLAHQPEPIVALYKDEERDRACRFKPYSATPQSLFDTELRAIGNSLSQRA
jgi:S-DNA-T family DNA segregation ATPase FtsK/SpoIIIE